MKVGCGDEHVMLTRYIFLFECHSCMGAIYCDVFNKWFSRPIFEFKERGPLVAPIHESHSNQYTLTPPPPKNKIRFI